MKIPNRAPFKSDGAKIKKTLEYMGEKDKIFGATKCLGKGTVNGKYSYCVSDDINLIAIKKSAKSKGLSVNDYFNTAAIVAFSKMDLPEDRTPSQFNVNQAISLWSSQS